MQTSMRNSFVLRIRIIGILLLLCALVIGVRLYSVQIVRGADYAVQADRQYVRPSESLFNRGAIFFTDKDGETISAAMVRRGFTLALNPSDVVNAQTLYTALNSIVEISKIDFDKKVAKVDDPYEVLVERIDETTADAIDALDMPGIILHRNTWRYYPGNALAAQTIGFVSFSGDDLRGQYGLERFYDDKLRRSEESLYINFFAEIFGELRNAVDDTKTIEGDIITSIEPTVQAFLEQQLHELQEKWQSDEVGGIIINPNTGEFYALGSAPTFDVNAYNTVSDVALFANPLVEKVYEMGSIIKPITMAIGIDSGAIKATDTYVDHGSVTLDESVIHNYDGVARGEVPMQEILNQSLNTGVVHIFQEVGNARFAEYLREFGIGEETGIDLPNEVAGLVANLDTPRDIELATASFGQGIALTPVGVVRSLSALANGGYIVSPHIVTEYTERVGNLGERSKKIVPFEGRQVISAESAEAVTRMLVTVVDDALAGGEVALPNYSIAAKTGTAQIAKEDSVGYYEDRYLHSFFGYFPAYEPKFLVLLYHVDPRGARYASQTLTDPFMEIANFLINYYNVPPDRNVAQVSHEKNR